MNKTVYKVVRQLIHDDLGIRNFSARSHINCLSYEIGKKTVAPGDSKIFCFESFEDASNFKLSGERIMIGIGENPKRNRFGCHWSNDDSVFWRQYKNKKSTTIVERFTLPKGTIVVDSFTPEKFVETGE